MNDTPSKPKEWKLRFKETCFGRHSFIQDGPTEFPNAEFWDDTVIDVIEHSAYEKRDAEAKHFCQLYNEALNEIIKLKTKLGEESGDY